MDQFRPKEEIAALERMDKHIAVGRIPPPDPPKLSEKLEQALVEGDLSKLSVQERVQFYNATCDSLGINPLTKPFGYIVLNGKLTLYALKACTDQLREKRGVSIGQLREEEKDGIFTVYAPATDRSGRTDEDMGAVVIAGLKGDNLCNAKMKAVTKAKRRVTLSICGLGMLDETEVVTIRGAQLTDEAATVREPIATPRRLEAKHDGVRGARGVAGGTERVEAPKAEPEAIVPAASVADKDREDGALEQGVLTFEGCVTQAQIKMLMSLCHAKNVSDQQVKDYIGREYGYTSRLQIKKGDELSAVMAWVAEQGPPPPKAAAKIVRHKR